MTDKQIEELEKFLQRLSFAYNNAALSNPNVDGDVLLDLMREELPPLIDRWQAEVRLATREADAEVALDYQNQCQEPRDTGGIAASGTIANRIRSLDDHDGK